MLIEVSINTNPTDFWKFKKKQRYNSDILKTLTLNDVFISNEQHAADLFTSYFKSVYSCEVINDDVNDSMVQSFDLPNYVYFTVNDVFQVPSTLCGVKTVGPDGLSKFFFIS